MNCGIVVRSFMPYKHKCALFDHNLGMIEAAFFKQPLMYRVHHGMLLEYSVREQGALHRLDDIRVVASPQAWVIEDIQFFHHFLEVLWFFVLYGQRNPALFELLLVLYQYPSWDDASFFKKWLLCRLFTLIGVYPHDHESFHSEFFSILALPYAQLSKMGIRDILIERELSRWIRGCVATHPQCDLLKTMLV